METNNDYSAPEQSQQTAQQTPPPAPGPNPTQEPAQNTGMAILAYLGILVLIPLLTSKDDQFVKFHIKQGLVLLVLWVLSSIFSVMWLGGILWLCTIILMLFGVVNAMNGKKEPLPVIGKFADHFHF